MLRTWLLLICLIIANNAVLSQVKIKLFSGYSPESALFTVTEGSYTFLKGDGKSRTLNKDDQVSFACLNRILTVKEDSDTIFNSPFITLNGSTGNDAFSLTIVGKKVMKRSYSGNLACYAGNGSVMMINTCPSEDYIAGVVHAEGGSNQNIEYYKTQAVLARTYMYKYIELNKSERDFLCDNTDCQVFFGITSEKSILKAVAATKGLVLLGRDNRIIECPFHSNCGGETSTSGDVWITHKPYLKSVADPFCQDSKNARWEKRVTLERWVNYLKKSGYKGITTDPSIFSFSCQSRPGNYLVGSFVLPFTRIRTEMDLPSAYFSVTAVGDTVILNGRGFGHGVGLCQEGAMKMAGKGYTYRQIINFYYSGVFISDLNKAAFVPKFLTIPESQGMVQSAQNKEAVAALKSEGIIIPASK